MNSPSTTFSPVISLCICTMNRPEDLNRCLESVFKSHNLPDEIIVSDDSQNPQPTQAIIANYSNIIYQTGPRKGLGANRNCCIRRAQGSHLIFIDDDVCVSPEFFLVARQLICLYDQKTLITGYEINYKNFQRLGKGEKIIAKNPDFWGIQKNISQSHNRCTLVINATIFPAYLFTQVLFDEQLRYGSDELDIARCALSLGFHIIYHDNFYVHHYPSPINRQQYQRYVHASRFYTTFKAYWHYEKLPLKALLYFVLAPFQLVGSAIKKRELSTIFGAFQSVAIASRYLVNSFKSSS